MCSSAAAGWTRRIGHWPGLGDRLRYRCGLGATLSLKNTGRGLLAELRLRSVDQEVTSSAAEHGAGERPRRNTSVAAHG